MRRYKVNHQPKCQCSICENPSVRFLIFQSGCLQGRLKFLQSETPQPELFSDHIQYWNEHFINDGSYSDYSDASDCIMTSVNMHIWHSHCVGDPEAIIRLKSVIDMIEKDSDYDRALKQNVLAQIYYLENKNITDNRPIKNGLCLNERKNFDETEAGDKVIELMIEPSTPSTSVRLTRSVKRKADLSQLNAEAADSIVSDEMAKRCKRSSPNDEKNEENNDAATDDNQSDQKAPTDRGNKRSRMTSNASNAKRTRTDRNNNIRDIDVSSSASCD